MSELLTPTITDVMVFGRGLEGDPQVNPSLTRSAMERVDLALGHIADNQDAIEEYGGTLVLSGGYAGDRFSPAEAPRRHLREGQLMFEYAQGSDIIDVMSVPRLQLAVELESTSTLGNALRTKEMGIFDGRIFTPQRPLGLVSHGELDEDEHPISGHAMRVEYFTRKAFQGQLVGERALHHLVVTSKDTYEAAAPEDKLMAVTKVAFFGARSAAAMRRRERGLMMANKLRGSSPAARSVQEAA